MSATNIPFGFHPKIPDEIYHAPRLGVASKTALDELAITPEHYFAWVSGERSKDGEALAFGRIGHCAIFEPDEFSRRYIAMPDFGDCRFKENKLKKQAWIEEHAGFEHVSADDMRTLQGVQKSLHRHELIRRLLSNGVGESTISWLDKDHEIPCKSRADYYVEKLATVVDLKLVADASPRGFAKAVANRRYFVQDALYRDGFAAVKKPLEHFVFVAVEKEPPFASAIYALDAEAVSTGYLAAREGIRLLSECVRANKFPGYDPGIQTISLPPWAA